MRLFDFVSVKLTFLLCAGIVFGFYFEPLPEPIVLGLACSFVLLFLAWKRQKPSAFPLFELATAGTTFFLGILVVSMATGKGFPNHHTHWNVGKNGVWQLKIKEVLRPNPYSDRFVADVVSFENKKSTGKLLLSLSHDPNAKKPKIDDEVLLFATAQRIGPVLNPHQFDYGGYMKKQGIQHQIRAQPETLCYKDEPSATLFGMAMRFREHIIAKLEQEPFGKDQLGVIQALLLGKRDDISEETYDNYKNAGAVHILAVSGLHVGILLLILQFALAPLARFPKGRTLQLVFTVLLLWVFAFVAGLSPSIVRAVTMFSFFAYARYLNRPTNTFNIIALSMFFILLLRPLFLFQVGFQMSYAAVFSIVWIYPKMQGFWSPGNYIVQKTWQLFSVSVAAQLGVLPISLFYFNQFPALFFVSNLLIIPFLGIILSLGLLVILLTLSGTLPKYLVAIYDLIIGSMNRTIEWIADQETFVFNDIPFDVAQMLMGYATIVAFVLFLLNLKWKNGMAFLFGVICLQLWAIKKAYDLEHKETLVIAHSVNAPLLLHQSGKRLFAYSNNSLATSRITKNFKVGEKMGPPLYGPLGNMYNAFGKKMYRADSFAILPQKTLVDILWITESPKINLERWLDSLSPKMIVSDASNYMGYRNRWKKTCAKVKIPFHDTGEKGAYMLAKPD